jgi:hypothetical protein
VVLLAPACSSFDQFENYEHRGRVFKELVSERRGWKACKARRIDKWLFFTTLLLVVVGLAMVFSASAVVAQERYHSPYTDRRQAGRLGAGRRAGHAGLMHIDYSRYNSPRFIYPALCVTTLLLVLVFFIPARTTPIAGFALAATSPFSPLRSPSRCWSCFWPGFSHTRLDAMRDWKHTLLRAVLMPVVFILLIVKQPDLGTALVLAGVTAMMLLLAGMEWKYLALAARALRCPGLAALLFWFPGAGQRMLVFLNPDCRSAGRRLPHQPVAHRRRHRRPHRPRLHGGRAEALLPARGRTPTSSSPTSPRSWGSSAPSSSCCSSWCFGVRGLRAAFRSRTPLRAWLPSASPPPFCCRPSSTSAWCSRWCPPKAFRCR